MSRYTLFDEWPKASDTLLRSPTLELEAFLERHDALLNGHSRSSRKNDRHGHRSIPSLSSLEPVLPHINGHSEPDAHVVTPSSSSSKGAANSASATPSLRAVLAYAQLHILNNFETEEELFRHLDNVDLLNAERLRPGWDTYFMVRGIGVAGGESVTDIQSFRSPSIDARFAGVIAVELHEASRWRTARAIEAHPLDRLQWHTSWLDQLQSRWMSKV